MRSEARERAFQIVFARISGGEMGPAARNALYRQSNLSEEERAFAERLVLSVAEHREELLALISEKVTRFADYRIYQADRCALLIALAEIKYFDEIPPVVSVNEAVALARKYSTENSADFVNGVLAGVINP